MKNLNKVIGKIIDIIIIVGILVFLGVIIYNLTVEKINVNKANDPQYLVKDARSLQIMEVISEKIYTAFTEKNQENISQMLGKFYKLNDSQIEEISENIEIPEEKIDAKVLEIYDLGNNIYRIKNVYKKEDDYSYKMDGKQNIFVIKLNRNKGTFKILDMKVGV